MNNNGWKYFYKLTPKQTISESNLLYTPTMNEDGSIMCMHYCIDRVYRSNTPESLTEDLVSWFFEREARFLTHLQELKCTPKVYDIDYKNQKIFIEWNKESLSQILYDPARSIDKEIPDWKQQLDFLFKEFYNAKHYKLSLYPHCFFLNKENQIKTIDYYSVIPHSERYIERKIIEGVIGKDGAYRFDQSTNNGMIDFETFHKVTINDHINSYWEYNPFIPAFNEVFS